MLFSIAFPFFVNAQQAANSLAVLLPKGEIKFLEKVKILSTKTNQPVQLKNGNYWFVNAAYTTEITSSNGLLNGTVTEVKHNDSTVYTVVKSYIMAYNIYEDKRLFLKCYRNDSAAYFKEYDDKGILKTEGWVSLVKKKHYLNGVRKSYYKSGTLRQVENNINGTDTQYYENGNKKSKNGQGIYEAYNEDGTLNNKQYTKNNVQIVDNYIKGKLSTREYNDKDKNEVVEYFEKGVLQKKTIAKTINGEKRILVYNKVGKLIANEIYQLPAEVKAAPENN